MGIMQLLKYYVDMTRTLHLPSFNKERQYAHVGNTSEYKQGICTCE